MGVGHVDCGPWGGGSLHNNSSVGGSLHNNSSVGHVPKQQGPGLVAGLQQCTGSFPTNGNVYEIQYTLCKDTDTMITDTVTSSQGPLVGKTLLVLLH